MNTLITQIARCGEVEKAKTDINHPCNKIVCSQNGHNFQLPEPYNGNIGKADILFVSSNPNIDKDEHYPVSEWSDSEITKFFINRFENTPKDKYSRYWKAILEWSSWILPEIPKDEIHKHIAITEVVHCKSKSEFGVKESSCLCARKWLDKVLAEFNGKYIVVVGKTAKACIYGRQIDNKKIAFVPSHQARGYLKEQRKAILLEQIK